MNRRLALATVVLAVAALACSDSSDGDPTPTPSASTSSPSSPAATTAAPSSPATSASASDTEIVISVAGGKVTRAARDVPVKLGSSVRLTVTADVSDEVHVHGYDLKARVNPGSPTVITFTANKPGGWEVELHDAGLTLVELQIR